jgi:hypothetical protein
MNNEVFCVIVSKFSPSCHKIMGTLKFLSPYINLRILDIDHPETRELVLQSGDFSTVPCIVLIYPSQNRIEYYERTDAVNLINKAVQTVQDRLAAQTPPSVDPSVGPSVGPNQQGSTPIQEAISRPFEETDSNPEDETRATMHSRTSSSIKRGEGLEGMQQSSLNMISAVPITDSQDFEGYKPEDIGGSKPSAREKKSQDIKTRAQEMMAERGE